jgi:small-conductance mechanosensitive channel
VHAAAFCQIADPGPGAVGREGELVRQSSAVIPGRVGDFMRRRVGLLVRVLPLLLLCGAAPSLAQDAAAPASAKSGPEIVAPADISVRADADERFAQDTVQRSKGKDPTVRLEKRLTELGDSVLQESHRFKRDELYQLSIMRLESLERHWGFFEKQLDKWRRELKDSGTQYTDDAAELARRRAYWEATRAAPEFASLAPALADRINSVLRGIEDAERAVSVPIGRQVRLSQRANSLETSIQAGQKAVAAAITYNDYRLTQVDSPPLWEIWNQPAEQGGGLKSVVAGLDVETRFLEEYRAATETYRFRKTVFGLLLLPLLFWLSYRSRKVVSDDPEIQASARVLSRPISSWLVLMMVSVVVFEPDAPILLHQVAMLIALIPVLRLLPKDVYAVLGPWPYVATALYLLHRLGFLLIAQPLYYRVYLAGLALLAVVLLAWVLWSRRPRPGQAPGGTARRLVRFAGWSAIAALAVSVVANVIGNVSLAEMLIGAILESGYVGLVLYAGVTVLASIIRLLLARKALSRFRVVTQHVGPLMQSFTRLLRFSALVAWLIVVMNEFRMFRPVRDGLTAMLTHEIKFGQISLTLGGVMLFLFSVWLAFWAAKTVRVILHDEVLPNMSLPRGVANSVSSLSYYAVVIFGLFVALAAAGFEIGQLAIVIGALGVGIGLGLQSVVNNFVSGLILMFERPIQPGDVVEVGGVSGKVREIGMRATTLSTFEGADVVVPNGMLLSEKLINWTLSDMDRRIDVNVGVAYGTDPRKVLELLMEVTKATPGIATQPEPTVLFVGFGANSLDFAIRSWTNNFGDWVKIRSDLTVRVYDALMHAGIEIPFPQQDVHVRTVSPAAGAALAGLAGHGTSGPRTAG